MYFSAFFHKQNSFSPTSLLVLFFLCLYYCAFLIEDKISTIVAIILLVMFFRTKEFASSKLYFYFIGALIIPVLPWISNGFERSVRIESFAYCYLFIPFFYIASKYKVNVWCVLLFAALGFLLSIVLSSEFLAHWSASLRGWRVDYGYNALMLGFIGFVFVLLSSYSLCVNRRTSFSIFWGVFFLVVGFYFIWVTQNRSILLIFLSTFIILFIFLKSRYKVVAIIAFLSILGTGMFDRPIQKIRAESAVVINVFKSDFEKIPSTSMGIRFSMWINAIEHWKQKPIVGWGSDSGRKINEKGEIFLNKDRPFNYLHNDFLEIMINYGLVGILFYFSMFFYLWINSYKGYRFGQVDLATFILVSSYLSAVLIYSLFNSFLVVAPLMWVNSLVMFFLFRRVKDVIG